MYKPESVLERETQKILWDFEIQMDLPISTGNLYFVLIIKKKRTWYLVDFAVPANDRVKIFFT